MSKKYICTVISLMLMLFFKYIPPIGAITPHGMNIIGIFLGLIIAYCTVDMIWPSIVGLLLLGLADGYNVAGVFKDAFGHTVVLYMFTLLLIGYILEESGLTKVFANWLVNRRIAYQRPWVLSGLILFAAFFCALFIGMIAPTLICWAIVYDICRNCGYAKGDKWPTFMLFTILFLSTVASFILPFQLGVVANFGILAQVSNGTAVYEYIPYLLFSSTIGINIFAVCLAYGKFILKPDVAPLMNNDNLQYTLKLDKKQKYTLGLFLLFVIGLLLPPFLPQDNGIRIILDNMGSSGWSALVIALGALITIDGKSFVDFGKACAHGVIWDIILMMAALFTLSQALIEPTTGVSTFILETLQPFLLECNPTVYIILLVLLTGILANLLNNIAVCAILIPIAYTLSLSMDINIIALTALMNALGNLGFIFPSSSSQAALIYNNTDWVYPRDVQKLAIIEIIIAAVVILGIGLPVAIVVM